MTRTVAGFCPMGCGEKLILLADGRVWCSARACPQPEATATILADPETEHLAVVTDESVSIKHPLRERVNDEILACHFSVRIGDEPVSPGLYRLHHVGIDPDSATLHDTGWHWEQIR